jgi:hypothetical protein
MALQEPFSKRNRLITPKEITIREDAPETLRYVILDTARELEYAPSSLRTVICRVLRTRPDSTIGANTSISGGEYGDRSFVDRRSWHFHESGFPVTSLLSPVSPTHLQRADGIHKLPSELLTYIYRSQGELTFDP